jgi:thioredoxin
MSQLMTATTANFHATIAGSTPVLVDFWAPWCGPCRHVAPLLEELAAELAGQVRVVKVNVDEEPALADRYGVQGIPTLVLFAGGRERDRLVGALPKPALASWLAARTNGLAAGAR